MVLKMFLSRKLLLHHQVSIPCCIHQHSRQILPHDMLSTAAVHSWSLVLTY